MIYKKLIILFTFIILNKGDSTNEPFKISDPRIVGGDMANIDDFNYQVSVMYIDIHVCGGSLVNPKYVLTAAHCTSGLTPDELIVRAGTSFVNQGGNLRLVARITMHPYFDSATFNYDLAILQLTNAFILGQKIGVINIPNQGEIFDSGVAIATGWGRLSEGGPIPVQLQKVTLDIIPNAICEHYMSFDHNTMICSGCLDGGKDTCQGDSGGPLNYNNILIGITSWGDSCGAVNKSGIYTNVAHFSNYIKDIVNVP